MLAFMATLTLILSLACWIFYNEAINVFRTQLQERLTSAAGLASYSIDSALHSQVKSEKDPAYFTIKKQLIRIKQALPYEGDVYTMKPVKGSDWEFLVDAADPKDGVFSHFKEPYNIGSETELQDAIYKPTVSKKLYRDKYGIWLSGYAPLPDAKGKPYACVALDMSAQDVLDREVLLLRISLGIFIFGLIAAGITSMLLAKFLNRPIEQLVKATTLVSDGDLSVRVPEDRPDELGQLARSFNKMLRELAQKQQELQEQERVLQELATARKIQQAMLPSEAPSSKTLNIDFYAQSASEVGGDYFDFLPLDDHQMAIVIGDVTGHGVPAALLMAMVRSCLHTQVLSNHQIADVMRVANNTVYQGTYERRLMTFFYSILDTRTGILRFANAGHLYPLHYQAQTRTVEQLEFASYPLGVKPNTNYKENQVQLFAGDMLVFYSDGIIEAQNPEEEQFGFDRLEESITKHGHLHANDIVKNLLADWKTFTKDGDRPPEDDVTVVVVKFQQTAALPES
jgi:sigma-B regulation protein RsbU (phosphoserine phosphatase)